jgi:hypothetical protein
MLPAWAQKAVPTLLGCSALPIIKLSKHRLKLIHIISKANANIKQKTPIKLQPPSGRIHHGRNCLQGRQCTHLHAADFSSQKCGLT